MATKVFQYVKGDAVANAQSYTLYKKTSSGDYSEVEGQQILHKLEIAGSIGNKGMPEEFGTMIQKDSDSIWRPLYAVTPIRDLTTEGYKYYIRFKGSMDIDTYYGTSRGVSFQGDCRMWFDSPDEIKDLEITGLTLGDDNAIYLVTNKTDSYGNKNVNVFADIGERNKYIGASIVNEDFNVYGADYRYRRTDPILIDDLTDNLLASTNPLSYACAGPFKNDNSSATKIMFYDNLTLSSYKTGLHWKDFATKYVTAAQLKTLRDNNAKGAQYVIFCSQPGDGGDITDDFVSLGGIYFMLTGNSKVEDKDVLVVKAHGDKVFFDDSPYSNEETYNAVDS